MTGNNETNWLTETIRFTIFPTPSSPINSPDSWWESFVGDQPDIISKQPKDGSTNIVGQLQDGDVKLILNIQPDRIDWQLIPNVQQNVGMPDNVGDLFTVMPLILEPVIKWLNNSGIEVERIAFGAILLKRTDSKVESYEELNKLLPKVEIDPKGSSDFAYQINRQRISSHISDLKINRLSKWSAMRIGKFKLQQQTSGDTSRPLQVTETIFACRIELDINTSAEVNKPIPTEQYEAIINELIELGQEIIEKGDIQ